MCFSVLEILNSRMRVVISVIMGLYCLYGCRTPEAKIDGKPISISGIYPHLAYYNDEGECGTGAVVPWADRLWVITYGPHLPLGSSDKLYEITPDLKEIVHKESIGGTPANRMIHKESNQLFIGPYVIDENRNVRVIPYAEMQGRHTGNARHLFDPAGKIYYGTMEEGFYEVDVNTLKSTELYKDGNNEKGNKTHEVTDVNPQNATLPGAHGKGLYSGQGVMVFSNNGEASPEALKQFDIESGVLAEWDGKDWKVVRRNQFVEVTGPGGIYGNENPDTDPVWATGWDHKSVLVGVRNLKKGWSFYRLPKASHSYDGAHGWNTEWPRIRDVGTEEKPDYLMAMHGMFWRFPGGFSTENTSGIRPRSAYLKVIGDYTRWNDQLVFGCDDSAQKEFLNKRKAKGNIEGPGQSNSNLWFTSFDKPDQLGPSTAEGAVWLREEIDAKTPSEPFLFAGWDVRSCWINNEGQAATFTFEIDKNGTNEWSELKKVKVASGKSVDVSFETSESGEWVRISSDKSTKATAHFFYVAEELRGTDSDPMFDGLADVQEGSASAGLLWGLGDNRRALGIVAGTATDDEFEPLGYYELDGAMNLAKKDDQATSNYSMEKMAIPKNVVTMEKSSVLIVDDLGRRWRLPKGNDRYDQLTGSGVLRICREVATERDLFNCSGTFYELPAENADGFAKIRPVSSHDLRIYDYASYRGLLVMTGLQNDLLKNNEHIIRSEDGKAVVWAGAIDDLWKLGKPVGHGGPWKNSKVTANVPSDPYLISFYDKRSLKLSHNSDQEVIFTMEVEPIGHGPWMDYKKVTVKPGETFEFEFPATFQSRWIRFQSNKDCMATAWLDYK